MEKKGLFWESIPGCPSFPSAPYEKGTANLIRAALLHFAPEY